MSNNYFFTVRQQNPDGTFGSEVGTTTYISIPETADDFTISDKVGSPIDWVSQIMAETEHDILIYIHGYNNDDLDVVKAHKTIKKGLTDIGYKGQVVSFDWPCGKDPLMYLPDRHKAKITALELVNGGITLLSQRQNNDCTINIHLLAHSTGAYVVREAFDDADDTKTVLPGWMVTELMFIEGDISSNSLNYPGDCNSIYKHVIRFTNYFNPYDKVLALSNLKRLGFENRVGRVGLPANAPDKYVDVNCGPFFQSLPTPADNPFYSHSFYFDESINGPFMLDLFDTIKGGVDRNFMPTRTNVNGKLFLNPD